ncbi:MAG: hypothetical protein HY369_02695 [Candidatus Aenigmarchaeota archaeon]|nr:hypothetical protein [Candidatus Aenigmarchaeota archaeon]
MDTGLVFAIIFTIIVVGVVVALGMGQIQSFFCVGSNAQTNKAVADIEDIVDEVFVLAKGSAKTYRLALPSDGKVCFVNSTSPGVQPYTDTTQTWNPDPLILEHVFQNPASPGYGSNVWIHYCDRPLGEGYQMKFLAPSKSFCAVSGRTVTIENKGKTVDIRPVSQQ